MTYSPFLGYGVRYVNREILQVNYGGAIRNCFTAELTKALLFPLTVDTRDGIFTDSRLVNVSSPAGVNLSVILRQRDLSIDSFGPGLETRLLTIYKAFNLYKSNDERTLVKARMLFENYIEVQIECEAEGKT